MRLFVLVMAKGKASISVNGFAPNETEIKVTTLC